MSEPERPPLPEPLPVAVIDDHTHLEPRDLTDYEFGAPLPGLESAIADLDEATSVGVTAVVQVGTDLATSRWSVALAEADARVLAAIAIHPNDAPALAAAGTLDDALAELDALAARDRVRAIGETGLDFFRTGEEGLAAQIASFEGHTEIAKRHGLALQITIGMRTRPSRRSCSGWVRRRRRCSTASRVMPTSPVVRSTPGGTCRSPAR